MRSKTDYVIDKSPQMSGLGRAVKRRWTNREGSHKSDTFHGLGKNERKERTQEIKRGVRKSLT
uniref:Uncharacterized protein n=1 Tax=Pristionchus pacificus TaxID=54126 RepID=A0A2A6CAN2_PRIPA|eukprot:PDM75189.1 hypothetical protein PRIPAC_40570 [Pristionchus pacificus]